MNKKTKHYSGYIEGFYGKLLSWDERIKILKALHENNFNTYFYAPKDDPLHRFVWRDKFPISWIRGFKKFALKAKKYNIQLIAGISPGLDFQYEIKYSKDKNTDFNILCRKLEQLINFGADNVAVLLDDIPNNLVNVCKLHSTEGTVHSNLINQLSRKLLTPVYFVPRVYAFEIEKKNCNYIKDISIHLDKSNPIFFCGKNIIQKNIENNVFSQKFNITPNRLIFWDNLYANDYCPKKIFIGTWHKRNSNLNIMVNLTGNIEIDILNLYFVAQKGRNISEKKTWHNALKKYAIPYQFLILKKFFSPKNSFSLKRDKFFILNSSFFNDLEYLLWKWKSPLSRELFPYLLSLKQELEIYNNKTKSDRIIKTQTITLARILSKERIKL